MGLIFSEELYTPTGKEIRINLPAKGERYLQNTEDSRRLGGHWHGSAVQQVAAYYK